MHLMPLHKALPLSKGLSSATQMEWRSLRSIDKLGATNHELIHTPNAPAREGVPEEILARDR